MLGVFVSDLLYAISAEIDSEQDFFSRPVLLNFRNLHEFVDDCAHKRILNDFPLFTLVAHIFKPIERAALFLGKTVRSNGVIVES